MKVQTQQKRRWTSMALVGVALGLTGCAGGLSGYDSQTRPSCGVSEGVGCSPVSDVYAKAMAGTLPGQQNRNQKLAEAAPYLGPQGNIATQAMRPSMSSGMPIRTAPRVMRIWFAPWKDELDVLHDQRHSYITLDQGRWLIEHNQNQLMRSFTATTRLIQGAEGHQPAAAPSSNNTRPAATPSRSSNPVFNGIPGGAN